jgi:hypothetical protein
MNWLVIPSLRRAIRRRRTPCRSFTLFDGMILVAGVAVGLVGGRAGYEQFQEYGIWPHAASRYVCYAMLLASCMVLILRLRGSRPPLRLVARQPGAVACFAIVAFQLSSAIQALILSMRLDEPMFLGRIDVTIWIIFSQIGTRYASVVPISWALLAMTGHWRPEPGWIDRSGRILGWAWTALWLVDPIWDLICGFYLERGVAPSLPFGF